MTLRRQGRRLHAPKAVFQPFSGRPTALEVRIRLRQIPFRLVAKTYGDYRLAEANEYFRHRERRRQAESSLVTSVSCVENEPRSPEMLRGWRSFDRPVESLERHKSARGGIESLVMLKQKLAKLGQRD